MPFAQVLPVRQVTAPDPDASEVLPVLCTGKLSFSLAADSDTAGAKLVVQVAFRDSLQNPVGTSAPITLVASQVAGWGSLYLASDATGVEPAMRCVGDLAYVQVLSLNPPTAKWNLGADAR